jgi:hypothetical protein
VGAAITEANREATAASSVALKASKAAMLVNRVATAVSKATLVVIVKYAMDLPATNSAVGAMKANAVVTVVVAAETTDLLVVKVVRVITDATAGLADPPVATMVDANNSTAVTKVAKSAMVVIREAMVEAAGVTESYHQPRMNELNHRNKEHRVKKKTFITTL